jgi:hypothetical protein
MPSSVVMEKQKVIIDELKDKIDLPLDDLNKLSNDELKKAVDNAICQVTLYKFILGKHSLNYIKQFHKDC